MRINLREIPEEGLELSGEIGEDIFQLPPDHPQPAGPVRYDLHVEIVGETVVVRGSLEADFEMSCVRCLDPFRFRVHLPDALFAEEIEGQETIDLTESVREDILLALPDHPHCEEAHPPRNCPAQGLFEAPEGSAEGKPGHGTSGSQGGRRPWADLEGFEPNSPGG
jgi:uncharacterized protein